MLSRKEKITDLSASRAEDWGSHEGGEAGSSTEAPPGKVWLEESKMMKIAANIKGKLQEIEKALAIFKTVNSG